MKLGKFYDYSQTDVTNPDNSLGNVEYVDETYTYDSSGRLASKTGMGTYIYGDTAHKNAVTSTGNGWVYQYDLDGNMTRRDPPNNDYYDYVYDAENRLYQASKNGSVMAMFSYDGDGVRVKSVMGSVTTGFVSSDYEVSGSTVTKYFLAGGGRVAMRSASATSNALTYLFGDQLNSTSATYRMSDGNVVHQLYKPWGEVRYASASLATAYTYTGQYSYTDDIATTNVTEGFGLMFYNARWLDPQLGRWNQPDTVIPEQSQGVQAWDRYAYVNNNPLKYNDPSGHCPLCITAGIGALVGGIVGGAAYGIYAASTGNFNGWALAASIGGGALAGALIGTGVGIAQGMSTAASTAAAVTGAGVATTTTTTVVNATGGDPTDEINGASKAFGDLSQAANYGVQQAALLKDALSGTGLQAHHIIEQRLSPALGQSVAQAREWLSVGVTPEEYQVFTNAWRSAIGYINSNNPINTVTATANNIWTAAQKIYADYPVLLDAAKKTIFDK